MAGAAGPRAELSATDHEPVVCVHHVEIADRVQEAAKAQATPAGAEGWSAGG